MAAAMARGLAGKVDAMLFSDSGSGRAAALAGEIAGGSVASNQEIADRADIVVLAVKPSRLEEVAVEVGALAKPLVSLLGATPLARVAAAFPAADVCRLMPNIAVEVRRGVLCVTGGSSPEMRGLLEKLGWVVELPDGEFDAATAVMGCSPAYLATAAEALARGGVSDGLDPGLAGKLVAETMAGTAELLAKRSPEEVRRAVASPGGSTEAGLDALERAGGAAAFEAAVEASLRRMRP